MDLLNKVGSLLIFVIVIGGARQVGAWTFWQAPPTSASCTSDVPFADTQNCTCYYQCFRVNALWQLLHLSCPVGGIWDDVYKSCVEGSCGEPTTVPPSVQPSPTTMPPTQPPTAAPITNGPPSPPPTTMKTNPPTTTTTTRRSFPTFPTSAPPPPPSGDPCPHKGFFHDQVNCRGYYRCVRIRGRLYRYGFLCPFGSSWNGAARRCILGHCLWKDASEEVSKS